MRVSIVDRECFSSFNWFWRFLEVWVFLGSINVYVISRKDILYIELIVIL